MGNIKETTKGYIKNLTISIQKENFEESERLNKKYKSELKNYKKEEAEQIISVLDEYLREALNIDILYYTTNLKTSDKINFLFNKVFEGILVDSAKFTESDVKTEQDVKKQINKIEKIYKKVVLISSINIIEEKLANLYFLLADLKFEEWKKNAIFSTKLLDEIIKNIEEAISKSRNNTNIEQIESYKNYRIKIINIKNKFEGLEYLKKQNYEKALDCFKKMSFFENIDEEKHIKIYIDNCYFLIANDYEEKKDYWKAIETLKNLKQNDSILQYKEIDLKWKIEYDKIEKNISDYNFFDAIDNYYNIIEYEVKDEIKNSLIYSWEQYYNSFLSLLSKITLFSYKNDTINDFISKIVNKNFKNERLLNNLSDLTNYLELVNKNKNLLSLAKISESIQSGGIIKEINQRIYLTFLIELYYSSSNKKIVLDLINNSKINLFYLSEENKNSLNNSFKNEDDIDILYLFSNIYENINIKGIDNSFTLYKNILQKLSKLCDQKTDNPTKIFVETSKKFIKIFKNIVLKSNFNLEKPKQLAKKLLFQFPEVKLETCEFLCMICQKNSNLKLDKEVIIYLIDFILTHHYDEIINIEDIKDEILNVIIVKLINENLLDKDIISLLFKLLIYYGENENKSKKKQDKIINYLLDINIQEEILTDKNVIKSINDYSKLENYSQNIIKIIKKIPSKYISSNMKIVMNEFNKIKKIKEIKTNINKNNKNKDNYQLIIEIKTSSILTLAQQLECESKLEDPEFYKQYVSHLKSQKELFKTMNLETISKKINSSNLELFYLICEKKKKWSENALISLLNGFYQKDKNLIKETFKIFNLIENYQTLPKIVKKNIEIERELLDDGNYFLKNGDAIIYEVMLNDFNDLKGFSDHHKSFINQIDKFDFNEKSNVYNDLINLLANKNYDIGKKAFKIAINKISLFKFIDVYAKILSEPLICEYYKMKVLKRMDQELHSKNNSMENIYSIVSQSKYFIEWIIIPPIIIETFLYILKNNIHNENIKKEIIFELGNYFSNLKENQKDLFDQFYDLIKNDIKFQLIKDNKFCNEIRYNEYIVYIYSCYQYYEKLDLSKIEAIPIQVIARLIVENQKGNTFEAVIEKINKYNYDNNYDIFCPPRDIKLRQLFVSPYSKSLDYLEVLK